MGTVIDFCARPSVGMSFVDDGDISEWFFEWELPDDTRRGDVGVIFAGGRRRSYIGLEDVTSRWKRVASGPLAGEWSIDTVWKPFEVPVPAAVVEEGLGFPAPRGPARLDEATGRQLVSFLRSYQRRSDEPVEAIEGIMTETRRRSRSRSPKLRAEKLRRVRGVCEGCGRKYARVGGLDGTRVLTVHHREQVSAYDEPRTTTLDDLAVLCANCHMLVHADPRKAMPVDELAKTLRKVRWDR